MSATALRMISVDFSKVSTRNWALVGKSYINIRVLQIKKHPRAAQAVNLDILYLLAAAPSNICMRRAVFHTACFFFVFAVLSVLAARRCTSRALVTYSTTTRLGAPCNLLGITSLLGASFLVRWIQTRYVAALSLSKTNVQFALGTASTTPLWMILVCITADEAIPCHINNTGAPGETRPTHAIAVMLWGLTIVGVDIFIYNDELTKGMCGSVGLRSLFYGLNACAFVGLLYSSLTATTEGYAADAAGMFEYLSMVVTLAYFFILKERQEKHFLNAPSGRSCK